MSASRRSDLSQPAPEHLSGSVAAEGLSAALVRRLSESTSVATIMTRQVTCLAPEAAVSAATELFLDRDLSAAPVVDESFRPLAIVSKTDLLRHWLSRTPVDGALGATLAGESHVPAQPIATSNETAATVAAFGASDEGDGHRTRLGTAPAGAGVQRLEGAADRAATVADVTVPYVLSLHEEAPIGVAAALMAHENVHRLPIVSSRGDVVGVVSTLDIVRWLAQSTGMGASE